MPLNNPLVGTEISNGIYTGTDVADRAIPHGLTKLPKLIIIVLDEGATGSGDRCFIIKGGIDRVHYQAGGANSSLAVRAMDISNFYVGNVASQFNSANELPLSYRWVAIG